MRGLLLRGLSALALSLASTGAWAQGAVVQVGPVTPGETAVFVANGMLAGVNPSGGGGSGTGPITPSQITVSNSGLGICQNSTGGSPSLCSGFINGVPAISTPSSSLIMSIGGVQYALPASFNSGGGSGPVPGAPVVTTSLTVNNANLGATWANGLGTTLSEGFVGGIPTISTPSTSLNISIGGTTYALPAAFGGGGGGGGSGGCASCLPLSGGTLTGLLTASAGVKLPDNQLLTMSTDGTRTLSWQASSNTFTFQNAPVQFNAGAQLTDGQSFIFNATEGTAIALYDTTLNRVRFENVPVQIDNSLYIPGGNIVASGTVAAGDGLLVTGAYTGYTNPGLTFASSTFSGGAPAIILGDNNAISFSTASTGFQLASNTTNPQVWQLTWNGAPIFSVDSNGNLSCAGTGCSGSGAQSFNNLVVSGTGTFGGTLSAAGVATFPAGVAITGGTIASADISGASVSATGSTTPQTIASISADNIMAPSQGVVCDGITNTATTLQAAITLAASVNKTLVMVPGSGECVINTTLTLPNNASIEGIGGATIKAGVSGRIFSASAVSNIRIRNLGLDGNYPTATEFQIINLAHVTGALIQGNNITNAGAEVNINSASTAVVFDNNTITNSQQHGVIIDASCNNRVTNNTISGTVNFGILVQNGGCRNVIQANKLTSTGVEGIATKWDAFSNEIIGNDIHGAGDNGISITGYLNTVSGNVAVRNAHSGIAIYGERNSITGNVLIDNGQTGSYAIRYACLFVKSGSSGLAQWNSINGNTCDDDQSVPSIMYGVYTSSGYYTQWVTGTVYAAGFQAFNGNILYTTSAGGTAGASAPTCAPRVSSSCSDGAVTWVPIRDISQPLAPLWQATDFYPIGSTVWNGANYYVATVAGTSASSVGPTCSSGTCTDGGVTWAFTPPTVVQWVTSTVYASGSYVSNAGNVYVNNSGGTSGASAPTCALVTQTCSDGTITWSFVYSTARDFQSDNNFIGVNNIVRYGISATFDDTSSKVNFWGGQNQTQTLNSRLDNTAGNNVYQYTNADPQMERSAFQWVNGQVVVYGDYRRANNNLYQVTNVGGTNANIPTCTSGSCTGGDGIAWRFVSTAPGFLGVNDIQLTSEGALFGAQISLANPAVPATTVQIFDVTGSPAGVVTAPPGSIALNTSGGTGTTLYVKETGTGTSGWVAK